MGTSTVSAAAPAPSPEGVTGWDDLAARLAALRSWAGGPSYAEIARRIRERRAERGVPPSEQMPGRSTIYDCFRPGRARVDVELFSDIVAVLASPAAVHRWRQALAAVEGRSAAAAVVRVDTLAAPQAALFVGRAPLVDDLLAEGRGSVSIVVGMPGVGKTELVLQVAALIAERQRPGVASKSTSADMTSRRHRPIRTPPWAASCGCSASAPPRSNTSGSSSASSPPNARWWAEESWSSSTTPVTPTRSLRSWLPWPGPGCW